LVDEDWTISLKSVKSLKLKVKRKSQNVVCFIDFMDFILWTYVCYTISDMFLYRLRVKINNKLKDIIDSPKTFFLVFLLVLVAMSVPLAKNINNRKRINAEIKSLEAEIKLTENKNGELNKLISYLESDQYIEEQARTNMGLKKDGEEVVVLKGLDQRKQGTTATGVANDTSPFTVPGLEKSKNNKSVSNPEKWLKYFSH
jgi:cell division protein FtsB